ncbi:hypothetical protein ACJJTC_009043 [Scirpophaga incertulas]
MFFKLFVVIALAMVASGLEYPPGVNPAACLDYPFCRQKLARVLPMSVPELVYSPTILPAAPITVKIVTMFVWRELLPPTDAWRCIGEINELYTTQTLVAISLTDL